VIKHNQRLIQLIASRDGKKKEDVIDRLNDMIQHLSDCSSEYDEYDMANYENNHKDGLNKPYKGYHDHNDYGKSDNEEGFDKKMNGRDSRINKLAAQKAEFQERTRDKTRELIRDH